MNGHHQGHNPHAPVALLFTHSANGEPAPEGFAFNQNSQLVKLAYEPWAQGPQIPWESFDNPDWVAFKKGDVTIERQPSMDPTAPTGYGRDPLGRAVPPQDHSTVALVSNDAYLKDEDDDDEEPTQENGTTGVARIGQSTAYARRAHRLTKSLVSYSSVPGLDVVTPLAVADTSKPQPLAVPPVQATDVVPPVGGCLSVSRFGVGHRGTQYSGLFDVPPGESVRLPAGASFIENNGLLVPKYYSSRTDGPTNIRIYQVTPGGPDLTNARFNTLDQSVLPANNPTGDLSVSNPNGTVFSGWTANTAAFTNTNFSQAKRRFYGSIFTDAGDVLPNPWVLPAASAGEIVQCPLAWYASQVTLVGNAALSFVFVGPTSSAGVTQFTGPFPANQAVQMTADALAIWVFYTVKPIITGKVRVELPFTLAFELSI